MLNRSIARLRFILERWVQRGVVTQLLLMACLVIAVAVGGGAAAWGLTSAFESLPEAIWWSFLRMTDPGYLGDDEGLLLRLISTVVTVLGYVLFMGSLIAIMTQWLAGRIRALESGVTQISMQNHFVILGWTNRTPEVIKRLMSAGGRLERLLAERGGPQALRIVVLAEQVDAGARQELRDALGSFWSESRIFLRSGSSLQHEHLERLDLPGAAVVIVPGGDFGLGGEELADTRVVKTLMTLEMLLRKAAPDPAPRVVAEIFDPGKLTIARGTMSDSLEVLAGDRWISRVLSQSLRQPGMADLLQRLLSHREGHSIYVRGFRELAGTSFGAVSATFSKALVLGILVRVDGRPTPRLNPSPEVVLGAEDQLILLAPTFAACRLGSLDPEAATASRPERPPLPAPPDARKRLLILGWNQKTPTLLTELAATQGAAQEVTICSKVGVAERVGALGGLDLEGALAVSQVSGDYSMEADMRRLSPHAFDQVLFMSSARIGSSEGADARTVLGVLLLRSVLAGRSSPPDVLVELLDPDNAGLLGSVADAIFVSPRPLSHLLAHVGLRPELNDVFDELICAGGATMELHPFEVLGLEPGPFTFGALQVAAAERGCLAIGLRMARTGGGARRAGAEPWVRDRAESGRGRPSGASGGRARRLACARRASDPAGAALLPRPPFAVLRVPNPEANHPWNSRPGSESRSASCTTPPSPASTPPCSALVAGSSRSNPRAAIRTRPRLSPCGATRTCCSRRSCGATSRRTAC